MPDNTNEPQSPRQPLSPFEWESRALRVLLAVEWGNGFDAAFCPHPDCGAFKGTGHSDDCPLAALLADHQRIHRRHTDV